MRIAVFQKCPNYHDYDMYISMAIDFGHQVDFYWDNLNDVRGMVQLKKINGVSYNKYYNINSAQACDVAIIVGGLSFISTILAHLTIDNSKKIFVSEGRSHEKKIHKLKNLLEKWICQSTIYLAIGENAKHYFMQISGSKKNIVDFSYYYIHDLKKIERSEYQSYDSIYIGRCVRDKGYDLFLKLVKLNSHKKFISIGVLDEKIQMPHNLKHLNWTNFNNIFLHLLNAKNLIVPSRVDPYGCVVQEGIMAGCNLLVSDSVGSRNHLSLNANPSRLFKCGDFNDMIRKYKEIENLKPVKPSSYTSGQFFINEGAQKINNLIIRLVNNE